MDLFGLYWLVLRHSRKGQRMFLEKFIVMILTIVAVFASIGYIQEVLEEWRKK